MSTGAAAGYVAAKTLAVAVAAGQAAAALLCKSLRHLKAKPLDNEVYLSNHSPSSKLTS